MRKLTYLVATSADGYIAAEDGSIDGFVADPAYLDRLFAAYPETCPGHLREPLRVSGENRGFDTALMGRATYEAGLEVGVTNPYPTLRQYVFSTTMASSPDPNVTLVASDPGAFVEELKRDEGMGIWLAGAEDSRARSSGRALWTNS